MVPVEVSAYQSLLSSGDSCTFLSVSSILGSTIYLVLLSEVLCPSKVHMLKVTAQCDGVGRWHL